MTQGPKTQRCYRMAKGTKTGGRDWKQEKSSNPSGRPKLPEEVREMRKLTIERITTVFLKYLSMTMLEMLTIIKLQEIFSVYKKPNSQRKKRYF